MPRLWADGFCQSNMILLLHTKGYIRVAVQNPTTLLEDDVTATKV